VTSSYHYDNEPLSFIKGRTFLLVEQVLGSEERSCSMELYLSCSFLHLLTFVL
jgi:hypothetical protein